MASISFGIPDPYPTFQISRHPTHYVLKATRPMSPPPSEDIFRRRPLPIPPSDSIGYFESLPPESFQHLLSWIPLGDVGNLALTSERMRLLIADWSLRKDCLVRGGASQGSLLSFSILTKRITTLLSTKERIKFMTLRFHGVLFLRYHHMHEVIRNPLPPWRITHHYFVDYFVHFGSMLFKFVRGWDESEYEILFRALDKIFSISIRLQKYMNFISESPADFFCKESGRVRKEIQDTERQLRLILRALWWDLSNKELKCRGDWLLANLIHFVGHSPMKQALVVFLMLGPTLTDFDRPFIENDENECNDYYTNLDWIFMMNHTPVNFHEGKRVFSRIAQCVCHLSHSSRSWRKSSLMEVLDCLFHLPLEWMRDNISGFLLFCNEKVLLEYMYMKLDLATGLDVNLDVPAKLLVAVLMECYKFDNELIHGKGVGIVVDKVLRYVSFAIRGEFFDTVWDLLLSEIEDSGDSVPIDEVVVGFGRFISKRSIYTAGKRRRMNPSQEEHVLSKRQCLEKHGIDDEIDLQDEVHRSLAYEE